MPKIYEYFGFIFYFYSNEHEPIHVHVTHGERECIFDLVMHNGELIGDFIRRNPHPQYNKYLDQEQFKDFSIENGNIVWGKNWNLIFPIEQLHKGEIL